MKESNLCEECKAPETVEHFILYCKKYNDERANMIRKLRNCNVFGLSLKVLLCGSVKYYKRRRVIYQALSTCLLASGRVDEL